LRILDLKTSLEAGFDFDFLRLSDLADEDDATAGLVFLLVCGRRLAGASSASGLHHPVYCLHHQRLFAMEVQDALDAIEPVALVEEKCGKPSIELDLVDWLLDLEAHRLQVDVVMM